MKIFPWERGEKPYFTNEEGFDWYIDELLTNKAKEINAMCFYVVKNKKPITKILIDKETNNVLYEHTNLESMACHIDMLRMSKQIGE